MSTIASLTVAIRANTSAFDRGMKTSAANTSAWSRQVSDSISRVSTAFNKYSVGQDSSSLVRTETALYERIAEARNAIEKKALNERLMAMEAASQQEWAVSQQNVSNSIQAYQAHRP